MTTAQIIIALIGGLIPALLWLWFWLREDKEKPEPKGLLLITFLLGMAVVGIVLPLERLADTLIPNATGTLVAWASIEELAKFAAAAVIALRTKYADEPVDFPIYLMTAALGFAALENGLFLLNPAVVNDAAVSFLTGDLRFLGATLLHAVASALIGISIGLSFYKGWFAKKAYVIFGIVAAIVLHSLFNFFIMRGGDNFFSVFSFIWVVSIIIIFIFEKLRRMSLVTA
ncbi:hypothetical protein COB64_01570 [Candidatus Wolfebacteria bacterium]|nr:MAG: hypothetical protein COB64_01570 [Candidatus Wolfebacteria bacterium]